MLHLQSVDQLHDFALLNDLSLAEVSLLVARRGRHLELLDLVDTLVNLAGLIHEVFEFKNANGLVVLDALPHQGQHIVLLSQATLLLQQ